MSYSYDEEAVYKFIDDERAAYAEAKHPLDAYYPIWVARLQFDAVTMGYPHSHGIHLNECRVALGLEPTAPVPPPANADQIPMSEITWLNPPNADISSWPATAVITAWNYDGAGTLCIYHTKQGQWPLVSIDENPPNIEANIGVVAKVDGQWYASGYDWMGEGRTCKYEPPVNWGKDQIRAYPLDASWPGPQKGEEVGLYMSTPASTRIDVRSVNERTNIIRVIWPGELAAQAF